MNTKTVFKCLPIIFLTILPRIVCAENHTIYGDFRYSLNNIDNSNTSTLSGENNASRLGFKGTLGDLV